MSTKFNKYSILLMISLFSISSWSVSIDNVRRFKWENLEVIWLPNDTLPTYSVNIYFADGALSDGKVKGVTQAAFDLLPAGTRRFSQKDISENLEFFGVSYGSQVNHEYASYHVSGLVKDIIPTMKKVCHLFNDATYPMREIQKARKRYTSALKSLVNNHQSLASRVFREISLKGSGVEYPVGGKLKDKSKWLQKNLKKQLSYFNNKVKKRIYITGPSDILKIERVMTQECGWDGKANFVRSLKVKRPSFEKRKGPKIVFVTVPGANQAQVRIGRYLGKDELGDETLTHLMGHYLGGGFTAKLMRELRVKRGLTYSANAFVGGQRDYGRAVITTFTKQNTIGELLRVTRDTVVRMGAGEIPENELARAKGGLAGGHLFQFERSDSFLAQLMMLDHRGKDYKTLLSFPSKVRSHDASAIAKSAREIFGWEKQSIVILGPAKILSKVKKFGPVIQRSYSDYL